MGGESRAPFWTFFWMIVGFKLVTSIAIFAMLPTGYAALFLIMMNWYVFVPPLLVIGVAALCWYRLLRARARRRRLIHSEWHVEPEPGWNPASARGTMRDR